MEEPRLKRSKISRGENNYLFGNVTAIGLHNFMTFSHLVCKPGPGLNLVIGPNGSGRSSLLLGRPANVGAYVKHGKESGYIKISLRGYTEEEQFTIVRKIDARNKQEWYTMTNLCPKERYWK